VPWIDYQDPISHEERWGFVFWDYALDSSDPNIWYKRAWKITREHCWNLNKDLVPIRRVETTFFDFDGLTVFTVPVASTRTLGRLREDCTIASTVTSRLL